MPPIVRAGSESVSRSRRGPQRGQRLRLGSVETIVQTLNDAGVRYLVVGGLAVVAHGFVRFTADVDLVLDLAADNLNKAVAALSSLGYRPRAPVPLHEFADAGA